MTTKSTKTIQKFSSYYNRPESPALDLDPVSRTLLSEQAATDVSHILRVFDKTGILPNANPRQGTYGDVTQALPFDEGLKRLNEAKKAFLALPKDLRELYHDEPQRMLAELDQFDKLPKERQKLLASFGFAKHEKPSETLLMLQELVAETKKQIEKKKGTE